MLGARASNFDEALSAPSAALSEERPANFQQPRHPPKLQGRHACTNFIIILIILCHLSLALTSYLDILSSFSVFGSLFFRQHNILLVSFKRHWDLTARYDSQIHTQPSDYPSALLHHGERRRPTCHCRQLGLSPVHVQHLPGRLQEYRSSEGTYEK
jgi:hypothetical protein